MAQKKISIYSPQYAKKKGKKLRKLPQSHEGTKEDFNLFLESR